MAGWAYTVRRPKYILWTFNSRACCRLAASRKQIRCVSYGVDRRYSTVIVIETRGALHLMSGFIHWSARLYTLGARGAWRLSLRFLCLTWSSLALVLCIQLSPLTMSLDAENGISLIGWVVWQWGPFFLFSQLGASCQGFLLPPDRVVYS